MIQPKEQILFKKGPRKIRHLLKPYDCQCVYNNKRAVSVYVEPLTFKILPSDHLVIKRVP